MRERNNNANAGVAPQIFEPSDPCGSVSYPTREQCTRECHVTNSSETQSPLSRPSCEYEDARERKGVDNEATHLKHLSDLIFHHVAWFAPAAFHRVAPKCGARAESNTRHFHQGKQGSHASHMRFFYLRPDITFPMSDFVFITLHSTTLRFLTTPI